MNKVTIKNKCPLPKIDDLFDQMRRSKVFSKMDLRSGYLQVRIEDEDVHTTTFKAMYGSYDVAVLSFGFTNEPATSMCLMNNVFSKFLDRLVLVLLDGILIYSKNEEEHVEHLRLNLKFLRKHKLYAGLRNYDFYEDIIYHLGHTILDREISANLEGLIP